MRVRKNADGIKRWNDLFSTYSLNAVQSRRRQLAERKGSPSRSMPILTLAPLNDRFVDVAFHVARLLSAGCSRSSSLPIVDRRGGRPICRFPLSTSGRDLAKRPSPAIRCFEADAGYDRRRGGADIAWRRARRTGISEADLQLTAVRSTAQCGSSVSFSR